MFIGHIALGLAARGAAPRVSLAVLVSAAQFADLLWPVLLAVGVEQVRIAPGDTAFTPLQFVSYPYSHSLLLLTVWGALFGAVYVRIFHRAADPAATRTFFLLAALVVSHWPLDFVTHRPDMPIYPGGPRVGLGLWNSIAGTMAIEVPMYLAGVRAYLRATRPRDRWGSWGFGSLAVFLGVAYVVNVVAPPPPTVSALWIAALVAAAALTLWAWWADRHREAILAPSMR
jgi:hypothetical protein